MSWTISRCSIPISRSEPPTSGIKDLRLLFISSFYLFPGTRFGGTKRLYYFAKEWERRTQLTLICMDGCREWDAGENGNPGFADFLMIPEAETPEWTDRVFKAPADRRRFLSARMEAIRAQLRGKTFDAVLLAFPWALSFIGEALKDSSAPVFYLEDDLLLDRFGSHPDRPDGLSARIRKRIRRGQTLAFYRPLIKSVRGFIGISSEEASVMEKAFPGLSCSVIRYGLPLSEFPLLALPQEGPVFGFIGNYGHEPNLDALAWLFDEIIPAVAASCPRARFIIAGKGIPAWAEGRRAGDAAIELRENVPELRAFYADISVFLNPIRTGRGLRTKLIEAAAFGRPIVTTPLGGEGLADLEMGIAVDAPSFAALAARFTVGDNGREAVSRNRRTVETSYALESVAADFLALMKPQEPAGASR